MKPEDSTVMEQAHGMVDGAEPLQWALDSAAPGAVIEIPPGEYSGPFFVRRPVTLEGSAGATLLGAREAVLSVECSGVVVRHLVIEALPSATCAISVGPGCEPKFESVEVVGEVAGLAGEGGSWTYPSSFGIGDLAPAMPNRSTLTVSVPVACEIWAESPGLIVTPRKLGPGDHEITIAVDHPAPNTAIGTVLWLRTNRFSRRISVYGRVLAPKAFTGWDFNPAARSPEAWETVAPPPPAVPVAAAASAAAAAPAPSKTVPVPKSLPAGSFTSGSLTISPVPPPDPLATPVPPPLANNRWTGPATICSGLAVMLSVAWLFGKQPGWLPVLFVIATGAAALLTGLAAWKESFAARSGHGRGVASIVCGLLALGIGLYPSGEAGYSSLVELPGFSVAGEVTSMALSPKGNLIAAGNADATVAVWDTATGTSKWTVKQHDGAVRAVAFSPDSRILASGGEDLKLLLADSFTGETSRVLRGYEATVLSAAFSPDGRYLAAGLENGSVQIWDLANGSGDNQPRPLDKNGGPVRALAWSPDGALLLSAEGDQRLVLWDVAPGSVRKVYRGIDKDVVALAVTADAGFVAGATADGTVRLWNSRPEEQMPIHDIDGSGLALAFTRTGRTLAAFGPDLHLKTWSSASGAAKKDIAAEGGRASFASIALDSGVVASATPAGSFRLWRCK